MKNLFYFLVGIVIAIGLAVACSPAQARDYGYIELSQGIKISDAPWGASNWQGDFPTQLAIGYHWDHLKYYYRVEVSHTSNILDGPPFNERQETWLDAGWITIGVKF